MERVKDRQRDVELARSRARWSLRRLDYGIRNWTASVNSDFAEDTSGPVIQNPETKVPQSCCPCPTPQGLHLPHTLI